MNTTLEKVRKIFAAKFSLSEELITPEISLESLGIDSLDAIDALFAIEEEFQIRVPQERGSNDVKLRAVQDILDLIERLVREQRPTETA